MEKIFAGKTALITGVGNKNGIGLAVARALAERGCNISFSHFRSDFGTELSVENAVQELKEFGTEINGIDIDLSRSHAAEELFSSAVKKFGKVDILINNAACSEHDDVETISADSIDRHYFVNVRTPMLLVREFVKAFKMTSGGRIINLTSGQALGPMPRELAYAASKAAMDTFMQSAAGTLMKNGITINSVEPGVTDTGWMDDDLKEKFAAMSPLGRVGTSEDIARLVIFLVSEEAGYITGQVIHSRGGV